MEMSRIVPPDEAGSATPEPGDRERIAALERQVRELLPLRERVENLQGQLTALRGRVQPFLNRGSMLRS
jgi:transposase